MSVVDWSAFVDLNSLHRNDFLNRTCKECAEYFQIHVDSDGRCDTCSDKWQTLKQFEFICEDPPPYIDVFNNDETRRICVPVCDKRRKLVREILFMFDNRGLIQLLSLILEFEQSLLFWKQWWKSDRNRVGILSQIPLRGGILSQIPKEVQVEWKGDCVSGDQWAQSETIKLLLGSSVGQVFVLEQPCSPMYNGRNKESRRRNTMSGKCVSSPQGFGHQTRRRVRGVQFPLEQENLFLDQDIFIATSPLVTSSVNRSNLPVFVELDQGLSYSTLYQEITKIDPVQPHLVVERLCRLVLSHPDGRFKWWIVRPSYLRVKEKRSLQCIQINPLYIFTLTAELDLLRSLFRPIYML